MTLRKDDITQGRFPSEVLLHMKADELVEEYPFLVIEWAFLDRDVLKIRDRRTYYRYNLRYEVWGIVVSSCSREMRMSWIRRLYLKITDSIRLILGHHPLNSRYVRNLIKEFVNK